jgi:hypothetical protein
MMNKIDASLKEKLEAVLSQGIGENSMKAIKKQTDHILDDIQSYLEYDLKNSLAPMLVEWVADMASRAVEQILAGNEDQMRRYLSCDKRAEDGSYLCYTGRSDSPYWTRKDYEGHPIIHGELFVQGAVELRRKIVEAHRELLMNERILDLEDQVKSLVAQVNRANAEKEGMWQRLRVHE